MASHNFTRCDTDAGFEDSEQLTTPTLHYYMPNEKNKGAIADDTTPTLSTFHSAQVSQNNGAGSAAHFSQTNWYIDGGSATHSAQNAQNSWYNEAHVAARLAEADMYNEGQLIRKPRHRANSSISTISMSGVPEFMSAGQLLSPGGLSATSRLFNQADWSDSAKVYALRGEEINVGLGLTNVNVLVGPVECEDIYQFHHNEESGGIPVMKTKMGGKKRRRDVTDIDGEVDGDFVAINRYHLDNEDQSSNSSDDNEGIAQGGALLEVAPTPFPDFDEVKAALLEAAGDVYYTMPTGPMLPGTMEYVEQVRRPTSLVS